MGDWQCSKKRTNYTLSFVVAFDANAPTKFAFPHITAGSRSVCVKRDH